MKINIVPEKIKEYMKHDIKSVNDVEMLCDWHGENYLPGEVKLKNGKTVTNLVPGKTYDFDGEKIEVEFDFPRTLNLKGLDNTRDLGNNVIKFGRAFRGPALKEADETLVSELEDIGMKTELDLTGGESNELVKAHFNYINIPAMWYQHIFQKEEEMPKFAEAIRVFADKNNYPIYFHCSLGRDRTGSMAMMLMLLCGMSEADCRREHFLSWFSLRGDGENVGIGPHFGNVDAFFDCLKQVKGPEFSVYENAVSFMHKIGITDGEIEKIRKNLME